MTSSEDVLMQVGHVKYKKDEGTLYVMSERLAWIQGNRDTVTLSHKYADIKSQKISPEGKPKIQLQIVLHDNTTFTFQFVHPGGQSAQFYDRNQVKEYLIQLLPQFRKRLNRELEEKNRILSENPVLYQLYKDLVTDGIISSDEFWQVHVQQYVAQKKPNEAQSIGVSSGFLSGLQPSTDGANGITYNLTVDLLESIFKTYPAVRKKHTECVPSQMDESEFWTKFFQSHYFHRDRLPALKDLFSDCAKSDDKEMKKALECLRKQNSKVIDIIEDPDRQDDGKMEGEKSDTVAPQGIYRNMIKRFNQHSIMILTACERDRSSSSSISTSAASAVSETKKEKKSESEAINGNVSEAGGPPAKKAKTDQMEYEDLAADPILPFQKLNLTRVDRYMNGPVPDYKNDSVPPERVVQISNAIRELGYRWGNKPQLLDSKLAINLLGELSPGGSMMKSTLSENTTTPLSSDIEAELRNTYICLTELLRHFWMCFPPVTPVLQDKVRKTHETLKKFEQVKLQQLKERLVRDHLSPGPLLSHITSVLAASYEKFNQWSSRNRGR